jgi:hypothetical protein
VSGVVYLVGDLDGAVDNPTHPPDPVGYAPPPGAHGDWIWTGGRTAASTSAGAASVGDPAPNGEGQARPDLEGAA